MHLSRNRGQFHRIVHFGEVQKIQTVFDTVQAQIKNLRLQDKELHGVSEQKRIWQEGHWSKDMRYFMDECRSNSHQKVCVLSDSVRCLCGRCQPHPHITQIWRIGSIVETPECRELQDMAGALLEFVTFEEMQKMLAAENIQQSQKGGIFMFDVQRHTLVEESERRGMQSKRDPCCIPCQRLRTSSMVFPRSR